MERLIILYLLICTFLVTSCIDDETPKDIVEEICLSVSAETGIKYDLFDSNREYPLECMLVMTEDNPGVWEPFDFGRIEGFTYERGHEYYLRVL